MATNNEKQKGVLVDLTRCIGCRGCQVACKSWNERSVVPTKLSVPFTNPPQLNAETYTHIRFVENERDGAPVWSFVKDQCMHCKDPACASACPVGALRKTANGAVTYTFEKCIGCRYCMLACPFYIPKYEWSKVVPWVQKCTFCADRLGDGKVPACIKVCPTNTMFFGDIDEVNNEAQKRMQQNPGKYVDHIYGKEEAGGTSWIYLSAMPFDALGFNMKVNRVKHPDLTWSYISKIPAVVGLVLTAGAVTWAITRRMNAEKGDKS
jgi:formate dehydrogenase iron-sulfur subunit